MKIRFNLLPESQKEHLRTQKNLRTIMEQEIYILIVLSILVVSLFAMYFLLKTEASIMKQVEQELIAQSGYGEVVEIHKKFEGVHMQMDYIDSLEKKIVNWSRFFDFLSENISNKIVVSNLSVSGGHVTLKAVADTREDVVELKEAMGAVDFDGEKCFDKIIVPESQLAAPVNVSFSMDFDLNMTCLE